MITVFSLSSLAIAIVRKEDNLRRFKFGNNDTDTVVIEQLSENDPSQLAMKWLIVGLSSIAILFLLYRSYLKHQWVTSVRKSQYDSLEEFDNDDFQDWSKGGKHKNDCCNRCCNSGFTFQLVILLINPIPFFDTYIEGTYLHQDDKGNILYTPTWYRFSDYLLALMFLRLYFLFRSIVQYSKYSDTVSKKICRIHNVESGFRFTIKCLLD